MLVGGIGYDKIYIVKIGNTYLRIWFPMRYDIYGHDILR